MKKTTMMNMVELTTMVEMVKVMVRKNKLNFTFQLRVAVTEGSELIPKRQTWNMCISINVPKDKAKHDDNDPKDRHAKFITFMIIPSL